MFDKNTTMISLIIFTDYRGKSSEEKILKLSCRLRKR